MSQTPLLEPSATLVPAAEVAGAKEPGWEKKLAKSVIRTGREVTGRRLRW